MTYNFEVQEKNGYILLIASGRIETVEDLISASQLLREKSSQLNCRRFLVDERMVVKKVDPYDLTVFAEAKMNEPERMRLAFVYSPENVSKLHWMETFFKNRSLVYRHFSSLDEAEQWLMSPDFY